MRSSLSATRCRPRRSNRVITSPTRRRCTPSGLTRTRVRSRLTARKSDMRASDRDRLLEAGLAPEWSDHRGAQASAEQPCGELADLRCLDRFQPGNKLVGLNDLPLKQELLAGVLTERGGALQLEQQTSLCVFARLGELGVADRRLGEV